MPFGYILPCYKALYGVSKEEAETEFPLGAEKPTHVSEITENYTNGITYIYQTY